MNLGKNKPEKKKFKRKPKAPHIANSVINVIPICDYNPDKGYYIYKDKSIMDIFQFVCKDLTTTNTNDIEYDIMLLTRYLRMYADDCKIISINIPTDCREQIAYFTRKIEKCRNHIYKRFLETKLNEEVWIEKNRLDKEFYLMIFAKSPEQYAENTKIVLQTLLQRGLIRQIDSDKKDAVLYKIANMNLRN